MMYCAYCFEAEDLGETAFGGGSVSVMVDGEGFILCETCKLKLITFLIPDDDSGRDPMDVVAILDDSVEKHFHDFVSLQTWIDGLTDDEKDSWTLRMNKSDYVGQEPDILDMYEVVLDLSRHYASCLDQYISTEDFRTNLVSNLEGHVDNFKRIIREFSTKKRRIEPKEADRQAEPKSTGPETLEESALPTYNPDEGRPTLLLSACLY